MLTAAPPIVRRPDRQQRAFALRALLRVSLRTSGIARTAAIVGAGTLPLLVTVARGRNDLSGPLTVLAIVAGASVGGVVDDPSAELLAPCPIAGSTRIAARLAVTLATVAVGVAVALVVGAVGPGLPPGWPDRIPEFAGAATVAVAAGLAVHRRGEPFGAVAGIGTGLIVPLTVTALAFRWPTVLPGLASGSAHHRWWFLTAAAGALACHAGRDVGRASLLPRPRGHQP